MKPILLNLSALICALGGFAKAASQPNIPIIYADDLGYLDGQIGRVLDAYDESPHKNNTIIVLWGDHGWHLGEKEHWRKFTLWEEATRAPFIWVVPGVTKPGGICKSPVDFMSVYPTLCDLAALPKPACPEGDNIKPLLVDPTAAWKGVGVTTFDQNNHAVRTNRWRYIRYAGGSEELYDHSNDEYEWTNLANKPEHAELKAELAKHLPKTNLPILESGEKGKRRKDKGAKAGKIEATEN
jgi:arylsulfatase A-like enzyme